MDPIREELEKLAAGDVLARLEKLEDQMKAKNTPRQPEPQDEPKKPAGRR